VPTDYANRTYCRWRPTNQVTDAIRQTVCTGPWSGVSLSSARCVRLARIVIFESRVDVERTRHTLIRLEPNGPLPTTSVIVVKGSVLASRSGIIAYRLAAYLPSASGSRGNDLPNGKTIVRHRGRTVRRYAASTPGRRNPAHPSDECGQRNLVRATWCHRGTCIWSRRVSFHVRPSSSTAWPATICGLATKFCAAPVWPLSISYTRKACERVSAWGVQIGSTCPRSPHVPVRWQRCAQCGYAEKPARPERVVGGAETCAWQPSTARCRHPASAAHYECVTHPRADCRG
jgi:hypothetical protein